MRYKIFTILVWILIGTNLSLTDTLTLPEPKGTYGVGTVNIELSDPSRTQLRSSEKCHWMATVFYPTNKSQNTYPYMPGTLEDGIVRGQQVLGHAIPNAQAISTKKFPIIISFPGRGGERQKESILYEALASHGYIVMTMGNPPIYKGVQN